MSSGNSTDFGSLGVNMCVCTLVNMPKDGCVLPPRHVCVGRRWKATCGFHVEAGPVHTPQGNLLPSSAGAGASQLPGQRPSPSAHKVLLSATPASLHWSLKIDPCAWTERAGQGFGHVWTNKLPPTLELTFPWRKHHPPSP